MVALIGFTRAIAALRGDHGQDVATQASIWSPQPRAEDCLRPAFVHASVISNHKFHSVLFELVGGGGGCFSNI